MGKIDNEFISDCRQSSICSIEQGICGDIVRWPEPFPFEYAPQRFGNVEMWAVWRQEEKEQSPFLPYRSEFSDEFPAMNAGIVKDNKSVFFNTKRKSVEKVRNFIRSNAFLSRKALMAVVPVNHPEDIEPMRPLGRNKDILTAELPAIRHVSFGTDMALVCKVKVYESVFCLLFEFLQLLGLVRVELRRGLALGTFPYTSISRANADKKARNVLSLASLPQACCQDSLAFFTLCLSCSIALRTVSSSQQSIIGLRPRPGRVVKPAIPSAWKRFTQAFTDICVISVCQPTASELRPWDFKRIARQRIRYAWLVPVRKPFSNCKRSSSVKCITLIFAITIGIYEFMQSYAKYLI